MADDKHPHEPDASRNPDDAADTPRPEAQAKQPAESALPQDDPEDAEHTAVLDQAAIAAAYESTSQGSQSTPVTVFSGLPDEPAGAPPVTGPKKRRRWPWVLGVLVLLLAGGYIGAAYATQDTLPATLTVEGIDVSGLAVEEAAPILEDELAARAQREITVTAADQEATVVPTEAGFSYDVEATLAAQTAVTFNPAKLWGRLFGEAHVAAQTEVDDETLSETAAGLAEQLSFDPTEGAVEFVDAQVDYTEPVDGFATDAEALAELLSDQWLSQDAELTAPGEPQEPAVSAEQWETFIDQTAQPLVADSYTVSADETSAQLTPAQLAQAAEVRIQEAGETDEANAADGAQDDRPVLLLDEEVLTESLADNNPDFESTNQDASIELTGSAGSGQPEVVPGASGRGIDGQEVVEEIQADLAGDQTRSISVAVHEVEPNVTVEDAEAWDVNHVVAEYATPYPPEDGPRTANLQVGADRINGTVVMPEEEFNLDALLGPITEANGYHSSGVVESGVTTTAIGGGLSQIATMAYNAGFLGGMEIVEHKPHSRWFDRYPQGRESTYWEGTINVRWKNDTDAPVIVEMWLADNQVHTRLWGSDYYDVTTTTSEPYNFTAAPTIRNNDAACIPERGGDQGFTVDVHRTKTPPDGAAIQESWSWAYSGWPTVICE